MANNPNFNNNHNNNNSTPNPQPNSWDKLKNTPFSGANNTQPTTRPGPNTSSGAPETHTKSPEKSQDHLSLKDFYKRVKDPFKDNKTIVSLLDAYSQEKHNTGGLYHTLIHIGTKNKQTDLPLPLDTQKFEQKMYAKWRDSVVNMTKAEYQQAKKAGTLDPSFINVHNFVKSHPECTTSTELYRAIDSIEDSDRRTFLKQAVNRHNWCIDDSTWKHVKSRYVNASQEPRIDVEHRFYLNTDASATYPTVSALVDTYEKHNLPYYFKFDQSGKRPDTIVVYTSTDKLLDNLEVIQEMQQNHPELAQRMHEPPLLTGKVSDTIGYGSEPDHSSYNDVRSKLIDDAINEASLAWVSSHRNQTIHAGGKSMTFADYVVGRQLKNVQSELRSNLDTWTITKKGRARRNNQPLSPTQLAAAVEQSAGYNLNDIKDDSPTIEAIHLNLRTNFDKNLDTLINSPKDTDSTNLTLNLRNGKHYTIDHFTLKHTITELVPQIAQHDPDFIDQVRQKIQARAKSAGISANFAFDTKTIHKMQAEYRKQRPNS